MGRNFPGYAWAWPKDNHCRLIKAVLLEDEAAALKCACDWLETEDIDSASFGDHRLLAAVTARFGRSISYHTAYPRLAGLQRQLWAQSQIAFGEAKPALKALADAAIQILLIKGASRTAIDPEAEKERVGHDIDICVRPQLMATAFDIITRHGFLPASGSSQQFIRSLLPNLESINLFAGRFGDIDLHNSAFPSVYSGSDTDRIWSNARPVSKKGINVLVPSQADRAAIAIAHGVLDAHIHSDWLVDCAVAIRSPGFSWEDLQVIIRDHGMQVPAAIVLTFLSEKIGIPVPKSTLDHVKSNFMSTGVDRILTLLQAKPRRDMGHISNGARWVAKQVRKRSGRTAIRKNYSAAPVLRGKLQLRQIVNTHAHQPHTFSKRILEEVTSHCGSGSVKLKLLIGVPGPIQVRRLEWEINGPDFHVVRLRHRNMKKRSNGLLLKFEGHLLVHDRSQPLYLESRPIRQIRDHEISSGEIGALPFRIESIETQDSIQKLVLADFQSSP